MGIARVVLSIFAAALFAGSLIDVASAQTEKRVALIVGNSSYRHVPSLANPANDARLMAETLKGLGFALVGDGPQLDLDKAGFDNAVQRFGQQLQGADVALFYYAGHGVQVRGANYLVPVAANPVREADVDFQMLDTALVLRQMEGAGTRLNLVVLDACRNNPFGGRGLRATDSGLAQMRAPEGTLISFATQPGNVALDGAETNSPFTKALAQSIRKPGLGLFDAFNEVGLAVKQITGGSQQPWVSSSPISGQFYFAGLPAGGANAPPATPPPQDPAERAWAITQNTTSVAVLEDFIRQFGNTIYGSLARARLDELRKSQVAVVAPPVVPAAPPSPVQPAVGVFPPAPGVTALSPERERSLKPKDSFKECADCPEMTVVPAGSFTMGSPSSEAQREKDEGPQHTVTFARQFAVGKFEATVDQFAAFVRETGHAAGSKCWTWENRPGPRWEERSDRSFRNPGFPQTGSDPAACLNWNNAKAYVAWLSRKTGKDYRLLTEAEWEYAARAGTATQYSFGDNQNSICQYGNGADQEAKSSIPGASRWATMSCDDGHAYTAPVGRFAANAFGLYDMHGNVGEWTEDCYNATYLGAPTDGSAWTSGDCSQRILRGGSWAEESKKLRSAVRDGNPVASSSRFGFRVARTLVAPAAPPRTDLPPLIQQAVVAPPVALVARAADEGIAMTGFSPFRGAKVADLSPTLADELKIDRNSKGVVILDTLDGSDAKFNAFKRGDIIVSVNDQKVANTRDLLRLTSGGGMTWTTAVMRAGKLIKGISNG